MALHVLALSAQLTTDLAASQFIQLVFVALLNSNAVSQAIIRSL